MGYEPSRSGGHMCRPLQPTTRAPVLTAAGNRLNWTWAGTNPAWWQLEHSASNSPFVADNLESAGGGERTRIPFLGAGYYRIYGADAYSDRVTGESATAQTT